MDFPIRSTFELFSSSAPLQTLMNVNLSSGSSLCILQSALARG